MPKIKNKLRRFWRENFNHFQEALVALTIVFVFGGFLSANLGYGGEQLKAFLGGPREQIEVDAPAAALLEAALPLPEKAAPKNVPKFSEKYIEDNWVEQKDSKLTKNDAIIKNLFRETLFFKILLAAKYLLGGVFMIFLGLYVINFLTSGNKVEASTKFHEQMLWSFVGFLVLALAEPFSQAVNIFRDGGVNILTDPEKMKQSAELVGFSYRSAAHFVQYLLGGVALVTMGISAFRIIQATGSEEDVRSARKAIAWAAFGLIIAGGSTLFVDKVFAPETMIQTAVGSESNPLAQHAALLDAGKLEVRTLVLNYVKYFQTFVGAGAVLMLFLAGFKMVSAAGQEEIITKQRKMITWIFLGLAVILVAETFVNIFMPEVVVGSGSAATREIAFGSATAIQSFSAQMGGFTNFLLTFSSALAMLALVVGALYIATAVANPEQVEKGKKILLAAVLGLILTISAYALVSTVLSGSATGGETAVNFTLSN